ncbi:MAG: hypothetical protein ACI9YT_001379 [Halobacteriales archaeon]|jgi:hypothetical protein
MGELGELTEYRRRVAGLSVVPPEERTSVPEGVRITRSFRGLTEEMAIRYLENTGAERVGEHEFEGDGWRATMSVDRVPVGPTFRLTEVTVTWVGDEDVLEPVITAFRVKAFRAPG